MSQPRLSPAIAPALGVALTSAATLALELTLIRLFSIAQFTHFAFMAVSLALLHSPDDLNMYFLSFTGTGLDVVGDLPHAAVVDPHAGNRSRQVSDRVVYAQQTDSPWP